MTKFGSRAAAVGFAPLMAVAIGACSPTASPTTQGDAEAQLCTSLGAFGDSLQAIEDLDASTASVEDVQAAKDDAQAAWDQVREDAAAVSEADDTAVDTAWQGVATAVDEFPTDVPVEEAVDTVQAAASGVRSAYDEMQDGLGCQ
jgi:hypothetical protein